MSNDETNDCDPKVLTEEAVRGEKIIYRYLGWSVGAGLIPFAFVDLAALIVVQVKMLKEITELYDLPFMEERTKSLVSALIGSVAPAAVAGGVASLVKMIPIIGSVVGAFSMSALAGASTWALGKLFIQHFERGGTIYDLDTENLKENFQNLFKEGKRVYEEKEEAQEE